MQQALKTFNKVITVEVSVDMIASQMLKAMDANNPHAALIVNTVIGSSLSSGKISFIYNALNGWNDEINITIGKEYTIVGKNLDMYAPIDGEKAKFFTVEVKNIDEYRDGNKVEVSFSYMRKANRQDDPATLYTTTCWINHKDLTDLLVP